MKVLGYSERGLVNALFYEMRFSVHGTDMLRAFLENARFVHPGDRLNPFTHATVLIEQSFSDFGDADAVILLDGESSKQCVFVEAKVKTCGEAEWRIEDEWADFLGMLEDACPTSNLFVQLYRKARLTGLLLNRQHHLPRNILGQRWSLGQNSVVNRAADRLAGYAADARFLALIPEDRVRAHQFFSTSTADLSPVLADWNSSWVKWGYLTWADIHSMCSRAPDRWPLTIDCFVHNEGQIFADANQQQQAFRAGTLVNWVGTCGTLQAVVKRRGRRNSRIRATGGQEFVVPNHELRACTR